MTSTLISGYTTTYNCNDIDAPYVESIRSMLGFCHEVVVVDGGSNDGTLEVLQQLARSDKRVRVYVEPVDLTHPRWAIHLECSLKAKARLLCEGELLWEMSNEEIVSPHESAKIVELAQGAKELLIDTPALLLPVVYLWGNLSTIRGDRPRFTPRLSRNDPRITHGIPKAALLHDELGNRYPRFEGPVATPTISQLIWIDSGVEVPSRVPQPFSDIDRKGVWSSSDLATSLNTLPITVHTGDINLTRSLRRARSFFPGYYNSAFKELEFDSARWNPFFKAPWGLLSEDDLATIEEQLSLDTSCELFVDQEVDKKKRTSDTLGFEYPVSHALRDWQQRIESIASSGLSLHSDTQSVSSEPSTESPSAPSTRKSELPTDSAETVIQSLELALPTVSERVVGSKVLVVQRGIPVDFASLLHEAQIAFSEQNFEDTRRYISFAENISPIAVEVLTAKIEFLLAMKEKREGIRYATRALWLFPSSDVFRKLLVACKSD